MAKNVRSPFVSIEITKKTISRKFNFLLSPEVSCSNFNHLELDLCQPSDCGERLKRGHNRRKDRSRGKGENNGLIKQQN